MHLKIKPKYFISDQSVVKRNRVGSIQAQSSLFTVQKLIRPKRNLNLNVNVFFKLYRVYKKSRPFEVAAYSN